MWNIDIFKERKKDKQKQYNCNLKNLDSSRY